MGNYEFFKKEFEFHGKHARMAGELWVKGDYEHTCFPETDRSVYGGSSGGISRRP